MKHLVAEIKKLRPDLPVAAIPANAIRGTKEDLIEAGFDTYLAKPFKETELFQLIEDTLKKSSMYNKK